MGLGGVRSASEPATATRLVEIDAREATKAFQVPGKACAVAPPGQTCAPASVQPSALERLRAGEIDRDGYLHLKLEDAVAHLEGLRPEELEAIKATLREQLAKEPPLVHLVSQAAGYRST
jgi:hypothetical protein